MIIAFRTGRICRVLAGVTTIAVASVVITAGPATAHVVPKGQTAGDTPVVPETELSATGQGAVTASDRDFVVRVQLAGTVEISAGNMAQRKGSGPLLPQIGKFIAEQHVRLDRLVRDAAARLGIVLPDQPTAEQQAWLREMQEAAGSRFDRLFVERLREAHGRSLQSIADVRAGTRNDIVRRLAQQANQYELTDMTMLESSGLVDYSALPAPPQPAAEGLLPDIDGRTITTAAAGADGPLGSTATVVGVLVLALLVGAGSTARLLRRR